jgi:hypothetical protein
MFTVETEIILRVTAWSTFLHMDGYYDTQSLDFTIFLDDNPCTQVFEFPEKQEF